MRYARGGFRSALGTDDGFAFAPAAMRVDGVLDAASAIDLSAVSSYGKRDKTGAEGAEISDGGASLTVSGNAWKQAALPGVVTIGDDTVLRFTVDIPPGAEGELQGIGLERDTDIGNSNGEIFQIAGTDGKKGISTKYFQGPTDGPVTIEIDLGHLAGQRFDRLVLMNDDDDPLGGTASMTVSNVTLTAADGTPLAFNTAPVTSKIDAGDVSEDAGPVVIDLLSRAYDADGDDLSVRKVSVTSSSGAEVKYSLSSDGVITIKPGQFGSRLDKGDSERVKVFYKIKDGNGGKTEGKAVLDVIGANEADDGIGRKYVSGDPGGFNVKVRFAGDWTDKLKEAFADAADKISSIITRDLPDVSYNGRTIDDIRITAELATIDGKYGIVGQAGPTNVRWGSYLPFLGEMTFDKADAGRMLSEGTWEDVIFHEMMHVIGFGTMWDHMGLVESYSGDLRFTGTKATQAYNSEFASIAAGDSRSHLGVPVETDGGAGTAGGHWDEDTFGREVMTGWVNGSNYVADITVAALRDMGYDTVHGSAAAVAGLSADASAHMQGLMALEIEDALVVTTAEDGHFHHHSAGCCCGCQDDQAGHLHDDPFALA